MKNVRGTKIGKYVVYCGHFTIHTEIWKKINLSQHPSIHNDEKSSISFSFHLWSV